MSRTTTSLHPKLSAIESFLSEDCGYESAMSQSHSNSDLDTDHYHESSDDEALGSSPSFKQEPLTRPKTKAQRPKPRAHTTAALDEEDADAADVSKPRRKPAPAKPGTKQATKSRSRSKKNIITAADRKVLKCVGENCEWNDALLCLGTKELNTVLKKGNFTQEQMEELKAARRRAKNRTYALRSRQKRDGKDMAPCPGTAESMELLARAKAHAKIAANAAAAAAVAKLKIRKSTSKSTNKKDKEGRKGTPTLKSKSGAGKRPAQTKLSAVVTATAAASATPDPAAPRAAVVHDAHDIKWEGIEGLPYGSNPASDSMDSDNESFSSFLSDSTSDWSSSSYTDSQSYDSESYESHSDAAPDFEFAAMSLEVPLTSTPSASESIKPKRNKISQQPSDLEAMMAELAGLRNDYAGVHSKLDQLASTIGARGTSRLEDGSVGIPAISAPPAGDRCSTPTPVDSSHVEPTVVVPAWAADPLFVDLKSGFQSLNSKIDAWLPKEGQAPTIAPSTVLSPTILAASDPVFNFANDLDVGTDNSSDSRDFFMEAMLGGDIKV